jgi:hypothetical protein
VQFVGEDFTAVRNEADGAKLLARTEIEELKRPPRATTPIPIEGPPIEASPQLQEKPG